MIGILQSIKPKWCRSIVSGEKTLEIRKTKPKIETPFKVLIYCTKNSPTNKTSYGTAIKYPICTDDLFRLPDGTVKCGSAIELLTYPSEQWDAGNILNGKVIGEYICDQIFAFPYLEETGFPTPAYEGDPSFCSTGPGYLITNGELEQSCMDYEDLEKYGCGKTLYGWHVSDFVLYDQALSLSDLRYPCKHAETKSGCGRCAHYNGTTCLIHESVALTKAPQSWREIVVPNFLMTCKGYSPFPSQYPKCTGRAVRNCETCPNRNL